MKFEFYLIKKLKRRENFVFLSKLQKKIKIIKKPANFMNEFTNEKQI